MRLGKHALSDLDADGSQRRHSGRSATLHGTAVRQHLALRRGFCCEGSRSDRKPLAPRHRLERRRVVVRHGDVEGRAIQVFRACRATDGTVVLGAAIGRAQDQRIAQPSAQRLQLVQSVVAS